MAAAGVPGTRARRRRRRAEEEAETAAAAAMGPFESMFKAAALAGNLCLGLGAVTKVWCREWEQHHV